MGLPIGLSLFQLWGCPASTVVLAGIRCRVLQARPFFGTVSLCLFKTLLFPSYAPWCRYDVPGCPALRQVLEAMHAEGALESRSILVLAFHSSLSLVEGSSDGLAAGDRFLSLGRLCLTHFVRAELSCLCAILLWGWVFLAPLGLTVDYYWIQWRHSSRKLLRFPCGLILPVLSLD